MKLLQLHWGFLVGGGSRYVRMLERLGERHGIRSHGICLLDPRWQIDETTLREIDHTRVALNGRLDPSWVEPVSAVIRTFDPDLIMTHGFNAHFVAWTLARRAGLRRPVVCSYHGPYHAANAGRAALGFVYERFTESFFRRHAQSVVTVAEHARKRLASRGVPADKITVIPNALPNLGAAARDADRVAWRQRWGVADDDLLIGAVGRLDPVKGQRELVQAFERIATTFPRAKLVLVGDGPDRERLASSVGFSACASRIVLAGGIPGADRVLSAFDIYALPSWSECHSIALLEAMRAGLPIVATAVGGNVETLTRETEGLLPRAGDVAGLAEALARLLKSDRLRAGIGEAARRRFVRDFTQDSVLDRTAAWLMASARQAA